MQNRRIEWIDMIKGLGMLLIMVGHAPFPDFIKNQLYTFHVPLFFFLSGYLFNFSKYNNFKKLFKKLFYSLVVPYISLSVINIVFWILKDYIYNNKNFDLNILKAFIGILYAVRDTGWTTNVGAMWFISCLIFAEILFYIILKISNNKKYISGALICCSLVGYFYAIYCGKLLPWNIDASVIAVVFYGVGYLIKNYDFDRYVNVKYMIVSIVINIVFGYLNYRYLGKRTDMFHNQYGLYPYYYISAFAGIAAMLILIRLIPTIKQLSYIGENSIIFLGFHQYILYIIIEKALKYFTFSDSNLYSMLLLKGFIYVIISCITCIPITYIIKRFFPFILGTRYIKNNNQEKIITIQ